MGIDRVCIVLIALVIFVGVIGVSSNNTVYGAESWITPTHVSITMTDLYATIHVHIKNNGNHVEYFKISQTYTSGLNIPINWKVTYTDPTALHMIDSVNPSGDLGWKIQPGQTKDVTFILKAVNSAGGTANFVGILNGNSEANTFWPLIPDPGLYSSWFLPNEIEYLNPDLDLQYWRGTFHFAVVNRDSKSVAGIVRAPIVPLNSKFTGSNHPITFLDNDLMIGGNTPAWDTTLGPGKLRGYTYTYVWPSSASDTDAGVFHSASIPTTSTSTKAPISPKETGVPYIPFVIGGILVAGGLAYARFR